MILKRYQNACADFLIMAFVLSSVSSFVIHSSRRQNCGRKFFDGVLRRLVDVLLIQILNILFKFWLFLEKCLKFQIKFVNFDFLHR